MSVRRAQIEDGPLAIRTLRESISALCQDDHRFDPDLLNAWLSNKTVDTFEAWLRNPDRLIWVSVSDRACKGVAMASTEGEVMLNYVAPEARFQGVSSALLDAVETHLCGLGLSELHLWSTRTAHRFYQSRGWQDQGPPLEEDGMICYPMIKAC